MNNKIIAGIVAVVLIGGVFYLSSKNSKNGTEVASNSEGAKQEQAMESAGSLKALMAKGDSVTCTFSTNEEGQETEGTVFVSKDNMRGDFSLKTGAETSMLSHMIVKETTSYIWTDNEAQGFKMSFDQKTIDDAKAKNENSPGIDADKNFNFKCDAWDVDNSKFELPSGVEFTEFAMPVMPAMPSDTSNEGSAMMPDASVCEQLPEPAKAQCMSAFKQ